MPKVSQFFGISIFVYWGDHGPPHFHARYVEHKASIGIEDLAVLEGTLSPRVLGIVMEWAAFHQEELREAWRKASNNEPVGRIEPL